MYHFRSCRFLVKCTWLSTWWNHLKSLLLAPVSSAASAHAASVWKELHAAELQQRVVPVPCADDRALSTRRTWRLSRAMKIEPLLQVPLHFMLRRCFRNRLFSVCAFQSCSESLHTRTPTSAILMVPTRTISPATAFTTSPPPPLLPALQLSACRSWSTCWRPLAQHLHVAELQQLVIFVQPAHGRSLRSSRSPKALAQQPSSGFSFRSFGNTSFLIHTR